MPQTENTVDILAGSESLMHTRECASQHFAPWMIEESWFRSAVEAVKNGTLKPKAMGLDDDEDDDKPPPPPYTNHGGIAVISLAGPLMKKASKFGGTSTVMVRQAIRKAVNDAQVTSILLHIDSPGGTVAGTADLAADVKAANESKPVYAHIDDLGASAAYWVASQARRITANSTALIGSIGTLLVLDDTSGMYAAKGIKVHVISTGKFKGAGADGAPVTEEHLAMFQEEVDDLNEHFVAGVSKGRKMSIGDVRTVADGRVHIASKAKALGLIDEVAGLDMAVAAIQREERFEPEANSGTAANVVTVPQQQTPAPEDSTRVEPSPADSHKETVPMSTTTDAPVAPAPPVATAPVTPTVETYTAQALQNHRESGISAGRQMERVAQTNLLRELVAAAPGKPELAINAFLSEPQQSAATVKLAFDGVKEAERQAAAQIATMQLEMARQVALASTGGYPNGVPTGVSKNDDPGMTFAPGTPPETQAKMEWDGNFNNCRNSGATENQYILTRVAQLNGTVRAYSKN